jgi:hypothetical protein
MVSFHLIFLLSFSLLLAFFELNYIALLISLFSLFQLVEMQVMH